MSLSTKNFERTILFLKSASTNTKLFFSRIKLIKHHVKIKMLLSLLYRVSLCALYTNASDLFTYRRQEGVHRGEEEIICVERYPKLSITTSFGQLWKLMLHLLNEIIFDQIIKPKQLQRQRQRQHRTR